MNKSLKTLTKRQNGAKRPAALLASLLLTGLCGLFAQDGNNLISNTQSTESKNSDAVSDAQRGQYEPAIKKFKNIITLQDQNAAITYNNLGYTYLLNGDYQNALENFQKAVDRNPVLVPALANLGKMQYQLGKYQEAVMYGEKTLALDPQNANVRDWLPDAYKKAADKRMYELQNAKKQEPVGEDGQKTGENPIAPQKPDSRVEFLGFYELAYDRGNNSARHYATPTTLTFPATLSTTIWISPDVEFIADIKTPSMGLYIPSFVTSEENIGFILHSKHLLYGMGAYFSQANFLDNIVDGHGRFVSNTEFPKRNDTKLGLIFGFQKEFSSLVFYIFPRYLFQDSLTGPKSIEFDKAYTKVEYKMIFPEDQKRVIFPTHFELALGLKATEYFVTEYQVASGSKAVSHYFGTYDIYADISFGKIQKSFDQIPMQFGILLGGRLHFQDFDNIKTSTLFNGQGYFGFNGANVIALKGKTFSSFTAFGFLLDVYARQMFAGNMILMEKVGTEFTSAGQTYNGITLSLGLGFLF